MGLEIRNLCKSFDKNSLFKDFNLRFPEATITCILGPSGCGKTTLLNIIANNISPDSGEFIGFDSKVVSYIFQDPRLLPWKTVADNIGFVLKNIVSQEEKNRIVNRFIRLVELSGFEDYYPEKLSGGMRQRVSIARAFAYPSDLILMDEPLKGLDIKLKLNLIKSFSRIWQTDKRTVIFVTHDVEEALLLGNEIVVFSKAPVEIKYRHSLNMPFSNRSLEMDYFLKLKQDLLKILGE